MDSWQPSDIKRNLPRRSVANNVEIHIPVPSDVDSPSFKTSIGTVRYIPDQDRKVLCLGLSDETLNSIAFGLGDPCLCAGLHSLEHQAVPRLQPRK